MNPCLTIEPIMYSGAFRRDKGATVNHVPHNGTHHPFRIGAFIEHFQLLGRVGTGSWIFPAVDADNPQPVQLGEKRQLLKRPCRLNLIPK
jgi:hypothetical protein